MLLFKKSRRELDKYIRINQEAANLGHSMASLYCCSLHGIKILWTYNGFEKTRLWEQTLKDASLYKINCVVWI